MDHKSKHENIAKIISQTTLENFLESMSAIEYNTCLPVQETPKSLVALEANFQLPNIFLKTKLNFKSGKLFTGEQMKANWNQQIGEIEDFLDSIDLQFPEVKMEEPCDSRAIEELIRWRFGTN